MMNYSAAAAISPAIERTKDFLFRPFVLGRFLKLTLVALLTEGGMASCNFGGNLPSGKTGSSPSVPLHMPALHWPSTPVLIGIVLGFVFIVIPIGLLLSYLLIRLRFSFFDCVLHMQDQIAPAWRRYHRQTMRYFGLSLCIGLAFWAVIIPLGYLFYLHFKPLFQSIGSANPPNFFDFLPMIAVVVPLGLLLALIGSLVDTTMNYFVLPRFALEDASIRGALNEVWTDIQAEPGQFVLFVVLRILLTIAASIIAMIALIIPFIVVVIIAVIAAMLLKAMSTTVAILLGIPAGILVFGVFFLALIGISGTIGTFRRNYALMFYAGRYPELAVVLASIPPVPPPPPSPFTPPPNWHGSGPASGSGA